MINPFKKKKRVKGAVTPEFRRFTPPPMPKTVPVKEDMFPDFDNLRNTAKHAETKRKEKCFSDLINSLSSDMKDNAARGLFEASQVLRQSSYPYLDLSNPNSADCQHVRDYIASKDNRFYVDIEPLDGLYKERWLKEDGVHIIVKWDGENQDEVH